jgi:hypothetical protein
MVARITNWRVDMSDPTKPRYDEHGRRLDPIPEPHPDASPPAHATQVAAAAQTIYITAEPTKTNEYVASSSRYVLRVTWLDPTVVDYEYVYLYDRAAPSVGDPAGTPYNWARVSYSPGRDEEASYVFYTPRTTLETLGTFWAAYVRWDSTNGYRVVARTPFPSRANWMSRVMAAKPAWGDLTVNKILLPGSHDTGTFDMVDLGIPNVYNQTQTMNFRTQLDAGVRWLDIRMGYYPSYENGKEGPFFTVHAGYASWSAWSTALIQIAAWLAAHPREVLFINFKWEGPNPWSNQLRTRVLQMSYDALKAFKMVPARDCRTVTVNKMLADHRVMLATSAAFDPIIDNGTAVDVVCPGAAYDWFDKYHVNDLLVALNGSVPTRHSWMWAAGTVLTPKYENGIIPWGVYSLTMDAIDRLNHWVRTNANQLNIVPVDFVESSVVLARIEELNLQRV